MQTCICAQAHRRLKDKGTKDLAADADAPCDRDGHAQERRPLTKRRLGEFEDTQAKLLRGRPEEKEALAFIEATFKWPE